FPISLSSFPYLFSSLLFSLSPMDTPLPDSIAEWCRKAHGFSFSSQDQIGFVIIKTMELARNSIDNEDRESIEFALRSLSSIRSMTYEYDQQRLDPLRHLIYGLSSCVSSLARFLVESNGVKSRMEEEGVAQDSSNPSTSQMPNSNDDSPQATVNPTPPEIESTDDSSPSFTAAESTEVEEPIDVKPLIGESSIGELLGDINVSSHPSTSHLPYSITDPPQVNVTSTPPQNGLFPLFHR
ncbi:hypothetical protein PFISCL1PPCAC_24100, partial [Pristionchus fissidentatus]